MNVCLRLPSMALCLYKNRNSEAVLTPLILLTQLSLGPCITKNYRRNNNASLVDPGLATFLTLSEGETLYLPDAAPSSRAQ